MDCMIRWTGGEGMTFLAETGSNHVVAMDGAPDGGGRNLAPRPMEMVLVGTGGCAAYDVVVILRKSGQAVTGCDVKLTSERAETDPERYGWPVTKYPDCVSCHVVGYGEQSGFVDIATSKGLESVGCEQCHGPGSEHAQSAGQKKMGRVGAGSPSVVCSRCHDFEQSPTFDYHARWRVIQHGR